MVDWSSLVANPESLGPAEKKLWLEVKPKVTNLWEELKQNGKIESVYVRKEREHLGSVMDRLDLASKINNVLLHTMDNRENARRFAEATKQFGVNDQIHAGMYLQAALFSTMLEIELFKLVILFHLKDVDFDVSKFPNIMEKAAPASWKELKPYVDNEFRNAIAHGTLSIRNKKVTIYRDAKLTPARRPMELADFMMRMKRQNVLYICLLNVLWDLTKSGWFHN
jgi:hypothetical protein